MTDDDIDIPEPGRKIVLEPTPPGMWLALLGGAVAVLAPLLGFVVGGALGVGESERALDPMVLSLFTGIVLGGVVLWLGRTAAAEAGKPAE